MTQWKLTWTATAKNYYARMGKQYQEQVREAVDELGRDPFSCKKAKLLHGKLEGLYRYRVGRFRMTFKILAEAGEVRIMAIASHGDIYK